LRDQPCNATVIYSSHQTSSGSVVGRVGGWAHRPSLPRDQTKRADRWPSPWALACREPHLSAVNLQPEPTPQQSQSALPERPFPPPVVSFVSPPESGIRVASRQTKPTALIKTPSPFPSPSSALLELPFRAPYPQAFPQVRRLCEVG
jgi:hypothetical protein